MVAKSFKLALTCGVLACVMLFCCVQAEDAVPTPVKLDNKDVAAYVVIQDVKKAIDNIERIAKQVMPPEEFQPGQVARDVGNIFGDPTMANLGAKPMVIMMFQVPENYTPDMGPPPVALFLPVKEANPSEKALQDMGMQTDFADGALIAARSPEALAKAKAARADYAKIAGNKLPVDGRAYINLASLMQSFGAQLKGPMTGGRTQAIATIDKLKDNPQFTQFGIKPELAAQLVHLVFNTAEGVLNQVDAVQLDVTIKNDSVLVEPTLSAKSGSMFADVLSGTPSEPNPNLQSFLTKGFQMMYFNMDMKSANAALRKMIAAVANDPNTADLARNTVVTKMVQSMEAAGGETIYSVSAGEKGPDMTAVATVADESKYLAIQESVTAMFGKDSVLAKIYANMGITLEMNFEKNVRQHAGVDIHRMDMKMDMPMLPKEQAANMQKMIPKPEMAVTKGLSLSSNSPAKLDAMIDKTLKGDFSPSAVTLKSMTTFGKGKNLYFDYDFVGYMKYSMNAMDPNGAGAAAFKDLKDTEPILISYAQSSGRGKVQLQLPFGPFIEMVKSFGKLQQGIVPKKPDTNDGKF